MQYIPISFDEVLPHYTQRLNESGMRDYEYDYPIPDDLQDDLVISIRKYIQERREYDPSFSLYIDCKEEDEDGAIFKGHITGYGGGPYLYVELQDDDTESYEVDDTFDIYGPSFLKEREEQARGRRIDGFDSTKSCYEIGDYGHIFTGLYMKVTNNKSVRMFLDVM